MTSILRITARLAWLALPAALALNAAHAQSSGTAFPTKPVNFIVPYPPGGPTDLTARTYAEKLARHLGQPVVVENIPGAQGIPAVRQLLQRPADGHNIYFGTLSTQVVFHVINQYRKIDSPYDARKDLVPVSLLGAIPLVVNAAASTPVGSFKELIDMAKAKPGTLNYGSDGVGSLTHLGGEMLNQAAGIRNVHIPYKGTAEFSRALLAGDIHFAFSGIAGAINLHKQGRTKILAIAGPNRNALIPEIPTVAEAGYPGFDLTSWFAVYVRDGTPPAAVQALAKAIELSGKEPDVAQRLATSGVEVMTSSPAAFAAQMDAEFRKWTEVLEKAQVKFEN